MASRIPNRRTVRLPGYDYGTSGSYFVTVCSQNRRPVFGAIRNGIMCLNALGALVWREWVKSFDLRQECRPGTFVVMPNHWHGVIHILETANTCPEPNTREAFSNPSGRSLPALMRGLKSSITSCARQELGWSEGPVCQSRYWEHVIRNKADYDRIEAYIRNNPAHWQRDCFNR